MIETHTINHVNLREAGEATQRREICEPAATFEGLFGRRPTLFGRRTPANSSDSVLRIAAGCGYDAVVLWTGSTNNETLTMQGGRRPGDIVLVHYRYMLRCDIDAILERARLPGLHDRPARGLPLPGCCTR